MQTSKRGVSPQYRATRKDGSKVGGNLGDYTPETRELEWTDIMRLGDLFPEAMAAVVNGQMHINRSGPSVRERIDKVLEKEMPKGASEVYADYVERTYQRARELATGKKNTGTAEKPIFVPTGSPALGDDSIDFEEQFMAYAKNFKVDPIVSLIREQWDDSTRKSSFLADPRVNLVGVVDETATAEEVEQAYRAKGTKLTKLDL